MDGLLKTGLDRTAKLANVENNFSVAMDIVLSVKEAIGSALQPIPIAALAWTGVCVALQVIRYSPTNSHHFVDIFETD